MWCSFSLYLLTACFALSSQDWVTVPPQTSVMDKDLNMQDQLGEPSILSLQVYSLIMYRYATTVVSSHVINPSKKTGEAVFTLILPESAFISDFIMAISGQTYRAHVKEKEEANATYSESLRAGHFAGHVAQHARDSNEFTVSVNLEAHGKVTFNLTYNQLLSRTFGKYWHVVNIDPGQIVQDMAVTVNIEEPSEIKDLEVPEVEMMTNSVLQEDTEPNALARIEDKGANHKVVVWAPTPEQQKALNGTGVSGQFVVSYDVDRSQNPQQILVDEGYFVHFFSPEHLPQLQKHVVFVLDFSGSMKGNKLDQLNQAMQQILSDIRNEDYFSIVIFQSYVEVWSPLQGHVTAVEGLGSWETSLIPKSYFNTILDREFVVRASDENKEAAKSYLLHFSDLGGTNIMDGLRTGLKLTSIGYEMWENESDPPQALVVFLTDGQPNVGEDNTEVIIDNTKALNTLKVPIFSLAFGYDADLKFLRKLSLSNFGFARTIYEATDSAQQLEDFYRSIASPLVSNVTFNYLPGQVDQLSSTKTEFPVYYNGSELVVSGKLNKGKICAQEQNATLGELTGATATGRQKYPIIVDCTKQPLLNRTSGSRLEKTWAQITIQQLMEESDSLNDIDERTKIKEKASNLALQYSFVTPFTSMVVVKPNNEEDVVDTIKLEPGKDEPETSLISVSSTTSTEPPTTRTPPTTTEPSTTTARPLGKAAVTDIKWLQPFIRNNSVSKNITIPIMGIHAVIGLNETDQSFGECEVNGELGECRHIKYCALNLFLDDLNKFVPYHCTILNGFLRVCCPYAAS